MTATRFHGLEIVPRDAQAALIIVHGITEHGARYRHVVEALAERNIASFVYDQRGHGISSGTRTHIANFADFAADLRSIAADVRQRFPELPLFVWGHSMGSVVVALAAPDLDGVRGIIASDCALDAMPKLDGVAGALLRIASAHGKLKTALWFRGCLPHVPRERPQNHPWQYMAERTRFARSAARER